jgi:non-canonical poly(A) RNA polymerase PAPD5/7
LETMGSRASGLADPLSDLDINVRQTGGAWLDDIDDRPTALKTLKAWGGVLRRTRYSSTLRILRVRSRARVPVLEALHVPTSLPVQIQHTVTGFNSTEYAKAFVREYPSLRAVFLVLKQMLAMRGLMEGRHRGLTSYPLLNMIVAHVKLVESNLEHDDVAGLLLSFLDRYGHVDFKHTKFSVVPPACLPKTSEGAQENDSDVCMTMIDPADPSNNLGSIWKNIKTVQELLESVHAKLQDAMEQWDHSNDAGEMPAESLLAGILEGDYTAFEVSRASLRPIDGSEVDGPAFETP